MNQISQCFFDLYITMEEGRELTEEQFVSSILETLRLESINARDLCKISACFMSDESLYPKWMDSRLGKFYFNDDINEDADTKKWAEYKSRALGVEGGQSPLLPPQIN
jgi:hypothetical protein